MKKVWGFLFFLSQSSWALIDGPFCYAYHNDYTHLSKLQMGLKTACEEWSDPDVCKIYSKGKNDLHFKDLLQKHDELAARLNTWKLLKLALDGFYDSVEISSKIETKPFDQQVALVKDQANKISTLRGIELVLESLGENFFSDSDVNLPLAERLETACQKNPQKSICLIWSNNGHEQHMNLFEILNFFDAPNNQITDPEFFTNAMSVLKELEPTSSELDKLSELGKSLSSSYEDYQRNCTSKKSQSCESKFKRYRQILADYSEIAKTIKSEGELKEGQFKTFADLEKKVPEIHRAELKERQRLVNDLNKNITLYSRVNAQSSNSLIKTQEKYQNAKSVEEFDQQLYTDASQLLIDMGVIMSPSADGEKVKCEFGQKRFSTLPFNVLHHMNDPKNAQKAFKECFESLNSLNLDEQIAKATEQLYGIKSSMNHFRERDDFRAIERGKSNLLHLIGQECKRRYGPGHAKEGYAVCERPEESPYHIATSFVVKNMKIVGELYSQDLVKQGREEMCRELDDIEGINMSSCEEHQKFEKHKERTEKRDQAVVDYLDNDRKQSMGPIRFFDKERNRWVIRERFRHRKENPNAWLVPSAIAGVGYVFGQAVMGYGEYNYTKQYLDYYVDQSYQYQLWNMCYNPVSLNTMMFQNYCITGPFNLGLYPRANFN